MIVPPSFPDVGRKEIDAVVHAMRTTYLSRGPLVFEFERALAKYVGTKYAVVVSSGTAALHVALLALGVERGDLVITTPISFIASSNSILFVGARPVFVDVDPSTFNIDPVLVEKKVRELLRNPKTKKRLKGILAVDIFGRPADWLVLERIAKKYKLFLLEDAGEALGAQLRVRGRLRQAGSFGDASIISFTYNKQLTTGEGGVFLTNKKNLADLAQSFKNHGREIGGGWLDHVRLGYNYHMSDINAALGLAQLKRLSELLGKRKRIAALYDTKLSKVDGVTLPLRSENTVVSWFVYVIKLPDMFTRTMRDRIIQEMRKRGIGCRNYFPPIHLQKFYRGRLGDLPIAEHISARTISLPFFPTMTGKQVDYVVSNFIGIVRKTKSS